VEDEEGEGDLVNGGGMDLGAHLILTQHPVVAEDKPHQ